MKREELIDCFQDTLEISKTGQIGERTASSIQSNRIYKEGFVSNTLKRKESASITVRKGTTLETAKQYYRQGRVAVLNFANPEYPGGGVRNGAMAQEECLCRSSSLYACISQVNVFEEYYAYHRNLKSHLYTDRLIYTKNVLVFKNDEALPMLMPMKEWFYVDVITCAAPYMGDIQNINTTELLNVFKNRIKNIIEAARDNYVDIIVLGAFGCGAFKNPPKLVAQAFYQVIFEQDYFKDFKEIIFAIKPTGDQCPNFDAFSSQFSFLDQIYRNQLEKFYSWQKNNRYFGKQFSILGDSISTLDGYNPKGYQAFYSGENCIKSGVVQMSDTWWNQVISFFGGELLVNNSWSGSRVTKIPQMNQLFPSGCSDERTSALHINGVKPDVIIVYLGTNDWAFGATTGNDTYVLGEDRHERFDDAYSAMLRKIKKNYPDSELWCCTLNTTYMSSNPKFHSPHKYGGTHIEEYNEIIRRIAYENQCSLIDLYAYNRPYDTVDGTHPNKRGMQTLASLILHEKLGADADIFFNDAERQQAYVLPAEESKAKAESEDVMLSSECRFQENFVGTIIDERYQILYPLIPKGNNQCYMVFDVLLCRNLVMEVRDIRNQKYSPEIREIILKELHIWKQMKHPAIQGVEYIEDKNHIFIFREYVEGKTLDTILKENGAVSVPVAVEYARQLCDVLNYLHEQLPPYIYGNMKPSDIIVKSDGKLMLINCGTARAADFNLNMMREEFTCILTSPGYSAPEMYGGLGLADARADIYSLGVMIYYLLTGHNPSDPPYAMYPIRYWNPEFSKGLELIILKCTQKNPSDRYQSCVELLYDLEHYKEIPRPTYKKIFDRIFGKH